MSVRVRLAPSPTGNLHLGTAYTALFNYLFAKKSQGVFILRFEDTDLERSKKEYEENILDGLKWLELDWDEGPFRQTERLKNYDSAVEKLLSEGKAYYCFCTQEELKKEREEQAKKGLPQVYSGTCRSLTKEQIEEKLKEGQEHTVRFKMPDGRGEISWEDLIHGKTSFDSKLIGDMVIKRTAGMPLYNFTVVVDDVDMKITHVLRAEDHLSNTPKQIVLFEALGAKLPEFAHWPNILNPNRIGKLSKRENATAVTDYRKDGFLPEAIINYLALLGWTPPGEREIWSLGEMVEVFDIKKMRKSPAAFDQTKLEWINGEYIRKLSDEELTQKLEDYLVDHPKKELIGRLTPLVKERIKKLSDFVALTNFIFYPPEYDLSNFKKLKIGEDVIETRRVMEQVVGEMEKMSRPWKAEEFEKRFRDLADKLGISTHDCFQLIRIMVSGQAITPPLFESIEVLGEEETLKRMKEVTDKYPNLPDVGYDLKVETELK